MLNLLSTSDRSLPHNLDTEKRVLGAVMRDPEALIAAQEILPESAFYNPNHQKIYETLLELNRAGTAIDLMTLGDALEKKSELANVGGGYYLAELAQSIATSANVEYHAKIVREKAIRRRIIRECSLAVQDAYDSGDDAAEILSRSSARLMTIQDSKGSGLLHISEFIDQAVDRARLKMERQSQGKSFQDIATGIQDFDTKLGGLDRGELFILAARPSEGKTLLAAQIAMYVAKSAPVLFYSLEMSGVQIVGREFVGCASYGTASEKGEAILKRSGKLSELKLYLDDTGAKTVERIASTSAAKKIKFGTLGLIVIDYLQLIVANGQLKQRNRNEQVAEFSREIKQIAKRLGVPVLLMSQLNRKIENDKRKPLLSDLRESGSIEQDADIVGFIHRDVDTQERGRSGVRELIIAKSRNGVTCDITLNYNATSLQFEPDEPALHEPEKPELQSDLPF